MFYTHSAALDSFFVGTVKAIADGVYLYQILRAGIWVMVSLPLIVMLRRARFTQYILMGALSALPSVQLFIPNPYMPADVAMAPEAMASAIGMTRVSTGSFALISSLTSRSISST